MTNYRKKLIEVNIPLQDINVESTKDASLTHGHPSTLHRYWARRPLAACRAIIFASMVDDPSECRDEFPTESEQNAERNRLHGIIKRLVIWQNSNDENLLAEARYEIAHSVARNNDETQLLFAQNSRTIQRRSYNTCVTTAQLSTTRFAVVAPFHLRHNVWDCALRSESAPRLT